MWRNARKATTEGCQEKKETEKFLYFCIMLEGERSCFDLSCSACSCLSHFCLDKAHLPKEPAEILCFISSGCWECWALVQGQAEGCEDGAQVQVALGKDALEDFYFCSGYAYGGCCCPFGLLSPGSPSVGRCWEEFGEIGPAYSHQFPFSLKMLLSSGFIHRLQSRNLKLAKVTSFEWLLHLRPVEELPKAEPYLMSLQFKNNMCFRMFPSN